MARPDARVIVTEGEKKADAALSGQMTRLRPATGDQSVLCGDSAPFIGEMATQSGNSRPAPTRGPPSLPDMHERLKIIRTGTGEGPKHCASVHRADF